MSNRRKAGAKNRIVAYSAAAVVHVLLIGALLFNFTNKNRETVVAHDAEKIDTVKASLINESDIRDQQEKLKKQDRERERKKREKEKREREQLEKLKKQAQKEKDEIKKLKDQQKKEKEKAEELEKERKAIALKKKKEEKEAAERKKKAEEARKKKAAQEKKRKAKEAEEKRKRDAEDAQRREKLRQELENEEAERMRREADLIAKERSTTLISKFFSGIKRKIELKRTVDPSFETWRKSVVDIKLSPSGEVLSVSTIESSGSAMYDQSVENAVYAASPFELPDQAEEPEAVKRLQNFELEVKHPSARR